MKMGKWRRVITLCMLKIAVAGFFGMGLFSHCAHQMSPMGGPRDSLPPVIISLSPEFGTRNFKGKNIYVEFDEYVQIKDLQKEFYTSPMMKKKPTVTIRNKGLVIHIPDTLAPNTTYALNFRQSVKDNNESNPLSDFRYVFSTGNEIDSMVMSGYTVDTYKNDSLGNTTILFFDAVKDSIPEYDSTLFNSVPDAVGRAQPRGIFFTENLKPIPYRVYAYEDRNNNGTYEAGAEKVGFLDGTYNPAEMEEFGVWYDTLRRYLMADPQLYIRMFNDETKKRQTLSSNTRPLQHKFMLVFSAPYPQIERLTFSNLDTTRIITEYLKPTRDSIAYWLAQPADELPDTIKGEITYLRHDSVFNLVPITQKLNLTWKLVESRQQERARIEREKEREEAISEGREPKREPNNFKSRFSVSGDLNPEKGLFITFDYPLLSVDSAAISLTKIIESDSIPISVSIRRDTMQIRIWNFVVDWEEGQKYELMIPQGAFTDVAGQSNDTLRSKFTVMERQTYSSIAVNVEGKTPESEYVIQLISSAGKLINEIPHAVTGSYMFNFVESGKVKLRIVEDDNKNGKWDSGNMVRRVQPERVDMYVTDKGESELEARAGWEIVANLDMSKIFAPITMQSIIDKIRVEENALMEKIREAWERRASQSSGRRPGSGMGTNFGGLNNLPF